MKSLEPAPATKSLESAPKHIQLAVDLIELLEQNKVDPQLALDALAIVCDDCQKKLLTLKPLKRNYTR
ncbi:MAG: YbaM family protein [Psychrosphaera sp.]|nr:YbaM family protein [Psychrosphaera sp.]